MKKICQYCSSLFSKNIISKHEEKCIFNPKNLLKILDFIYSSQGNPKLLTKSKYNIFAKKNNILSGKTLISMLKINKWNHLLVFLILKFYELGYIEDLEIFDIIIYKLSYKTMLYDNATLAELNNKILIEEMKACGFSYSEIDFSSQFENLYAAIIIRAVRDLTSSIYQDVEITEDDKIDAFYFLQEEVPNLLKKILNLHPELNRYSAI